MAHITSYIRTSPYVESHKFTKTFTVWCLQGFHATSQQPRAERIRGASQKGHGIFWLLLENLNLWFRVLGSGV